LNDFNDELPVMNRFYKRLVHIPCGWWVSREDRETILRTIKEGW